MSGIIYIISAPSGSGKTTLANMLRDSVPGIYFSVSYTTRPPRGGEQEGHEYHFVSMDEFQRMLEHDEFLEHANVYGNFYGTSKQALQEARRRGEDLLLDIDVQGEAQIKKKIPQAVSIFILPPSKEALEKRLRSRHDSYAAKIDSEDTIKRRLLTATKEIENYPNYDYILINDRLDTSVDQLKAIVLAERIKRSGTELTAASAQLVATAERCLLPNVRERVKPILASFALSATMPGGD